MIEQWPGINSCILTQKDSELIIQNPFYSGYFFFESFFLEDFSPAVSFRMR